MSEDYSSSATRVLALGGAFAVIMACGSTADACDRDRLATGALRATMGRDDLVVARRASGRPRLLPPFPELGVSMSFRQGLLLVGYAPSGRVGVDVEIAGPELDPVRLAADHFAPAEAAAVAHAPNPAAARALFLRLWVAKEAVLKASGRGIYDGVDEPDLTAYLDELIIDGAAVTVAVGSRVPSHRLTVTSLPRAGVGPAYCALAVVSD